VISAGHCFRGWVSSLKDVGICASGFALTNRLPRSGTWGWALRYYRLLRPSLRMSDVILGQRQPESDQGLSRVWQIGKGIGPERELPTRRASKVLMWLRMSPEEAGRGLWRAIESVRITNARVPYGRRVFGQLLQLEDVESGLPGATLNRGSPFDRDAFLALADYAEQTAVCACG